MKRIPPPLTVAPRHAILVATTSATVLAYEILLMRLLSIAYWHHFAYMAISMALLGFGAAGSLLFLSFDRIRGHMEEWLVCLAAGTALSFPLAFTLSQKLGLDPLQLVWQPTQWFAMLFTYLLMAGPFFLTGMIVGIILTGAGRQVHRMYAADLLGAGCGALGIVPALYVGPPWILLPVLGYLVLVAAFWCCLRMRRRTVGAGILLVAAGVLSVAYILIPPVPKIHHTKGLPMTLLFPDARIEAERVGPLGMIQVVGSALIRQVPGLSLNFGLNREGDGGELPEQKAIFVDGDGLSPITRFNGDLATLKYLDYTTMALPHFIRKPKTLLVIGSGGGTDVLSGLLHHIPKITALEANKQIAELLTRDFAEFSGHLYSRPGVSLKVREARQFLHATKAQFDLIQLSLLDSFVSSAGGLHSATESYLYTVEALKLYLSHLTDSGILSITRWLKLPPRDSLRIVAAALSALRGMGISHQPESHILFIRSWNTSTILISRPPFTPTEIAHATAFCDARSFDLAYYAGMERRRANRYDVQGAPYYFLGAKALCGPEAGSFLESYVFDVSPTTDDRPYFYHFFKWDKAPELFRYLRKEWLPMIELGYIFILATLAQAILASGALILLPLMFLRRVHKGPSEAQLVPKTKDILAPLVYFGAIGVGFMFVEMALIPKYTLLLSHPVYSAALVMSSVLVFAGLGSLSVKRFQARSSWFLWIPVVVFVFWVSFDVLAGDSLLGVAMGWSFPGRLALAGTMVSVLSFFLGWPFPSGLRVLGERFPPLIPWAWGINGCTSVIGAVLGKCLAVSIGFQGVMLVAGGLYLVAVTIFHVSLRDGNSRSSL